MSSAPRAAGRETLRDATIVAALLLHLGYAPVRAHTITVDGDPSDWTMSAPPIENLAHFARSATGGGELVWLDASGDERTDFASPDPRVDLLELRITGDETHLFVLALLSDLPPDALSGDGAPQISMALDLDGDPSSGNESFLGFSDTNVAAEWERLVFTRLGSGNADISIWDENFQNEVAGTSAADAVLDAFELAIPWSSLGSAGPVDRVRFTVALFRSDTSDLAQDIGGPAISDALDVITNYGNPGASPAPNTIDEVSDLTVDYSFEVFFESDGDPIAPLLISEVLYDPTAADPAGEFIEIVNHSPLPYHLAGCKIGDEETPGDVEGMVLLSPYLLHPGGRAVLARDGDVFAAVYGFPPDFAMEPGSQSLAGATSPFTTWSAGSVALHNGGDEILLLDAFDTVLDAVTYGTGSWPGVLGSLSGAPEGSSLQRIEPPVDTDDVDADFETVCCEGRPVRNLVFIDGFESGALTAWSGVNP